MQIYITKGVQQIGPFSEGEIREMLESGNAMQADLAWCEGRSDWVSLSEILSITPRTNQPSEPGNIPEISDSTDTAIDEPQHIDERGVIAGRNGPPPLPLWSPNDCGPSSPQKLREVGQSKYALLASNTPEGSSIAAPTRKPRSILWMTVWAFLWPGLGQILCGQRKKGIVIIILGFFILIETAWTVLIPFMIATASAIDAYKVAKRVANGKAVGEWEFFPDEKP